MHTWYISKRYIYIEAGLAVRKSFTFYITWSPGAWLWSAITCIQKLILKAHNLYVKPR